MYTMQSTVAYKFIRARSFLSRGADFITSRRTAAAVDFSGRRLYHRRSISPLEVSRSGLCFYKHLNGFLSSSDSNSPRLLPPQRPEWMLNGYAGLSTSTGSDMESTKKPSKQEPKAAIVKRGGSPEQVADTKILGTLFKYLWVKDNLETRLRVFAALGFLIGAKVLNVQVPFLFKLAVDWLTTATGNASALASFTAANSTALALFVSPAAVLIGYGIARAGAAAFNELRTAVFSKVALRTIRSVSRKVFSHLHELDLNYHLSRETGGLNRIIDRGSRAINFILSAMVFNVVPTILEALLLTEPYTVREEWGNAKRPVQLSLTRECG